MVYSGMVYYSVVNLIGTSWGALKGGIEIERHGQRDRDIYIYIYSYGYRHKYVHINVWLEPLRGL